jgi:hypothetical protein
LLQQSIHGRVKEAALEPSNREEWQLAKTKGFFAGAVRKRLGLKLTSEKIDGIRVYRIASGKAAKKSAAATVAKAS